MLTCTTHFLLTLLLQNGKFYPLEVTVTYLLNSDSTTLLLQCERTFPLLLLVGKCGGGLDIWGASSHAGITGLSHITLLLPWRKNISTLWYLSVGGEWRLYWSDWGHRQSWRGRRSKSRMCTRNEKVFESLGIVWTDTIICNLIYAFKLPLVRLLNEVGGI